LGRREEVSWRRELITKANAEEMSKRMQTMKCHYIS
jgi:hypothetical protein